MTLYELRERLADNKYVTDNPNQIIDIILEQFEKNDDSLSANVYSDKESDQSENVREIIRLFKYLFAKNKEKIDFIHFEKYSSFIRANQKYYFNDEVYASIFRYVSNYNDSEIMKIITEFSDELLYDNLATLLILLNKQNRLNSNLLKDVLNVSSGVDVAYFSYLIPKLSDELIEIISDYDINIINYLDAERISEELLQKAKNDEKYELTDESPDKLFEDLQFIKKYIQHHPYKVKEIKKLHGNQELLELAINNGLIVNYNDFKERKIFTVDLFIREFEEYFKNLKEQNFDSITVITRLCSGNEENKISQLYDLLKYALNNYEGSSKIIEFLKTKRVSILLKSFEEDNLDIEFVLDKPSIVYNLLESLDNEYANKISFEPNIEFVDKFFQLGYSVGPFSSEKILNSKLLFNKSINYDSFQISRCLQFCNQDFITKEYIDLALQKNVDILDNGIYEKTDIILKKSVEDKLSLIDDINYKKFVLNIINLAGFSVYYVEHNNLLSKEVFYTFDEGLIIKLVRNLSFCGGKLDFSPLIAMDKINVFKKFYDFAKFNGNALEFKYLLEFFNSNLELVENLLKEEMTEEEKNGLKEYVYHKDKLFKISNKKYLSDMRRTIYLTNQEFITNEKDNDIVLKSIIFSTLFNNGYYEIGNFLGIVGNNRLDNLKNSIKDINILNEIKTLKPYVNFIEMVYLCNNNEKLIEIANNVNEYYYSYGEEVDQIKFFFNNIESKIKNIYIEELNSKLTKLPDGDYIELDEDSFFFAHVMNAFGNGSKLSDFKKARFIGKTYICLTAIGLGVKPYSRKEIDKDHVTVLFNRIAYNSLISMSSRDMWSQGGNGQLDVIVHNNFNTLNAILNETTDGVPNEYVVYRETESGIILYPCAILVVGEKPSQPEIEAAKYLNVSLVKRKQIKKTEKSNNNGEALATNEVSDSTVDNSFYEYILEKVKIQNEFHYKL